MPRKATTKSTAKVATVEESTVATVEAVENVNEQEKVVETTAVKVEPLMDSDEIQVISLIPNVSYKDSRTGDFYEWNEVGHIEYLTFETLKNMWRTAKGYFRNMWLKPLDERVVNKFGLTSTYANYEFLMDESNYTRDNMDKLGASIAATPNGMKFAICNKIKNMVIDGSLTDIAVIKALEKRLNLDLTSFLN